MQPFHIDQDTSIHQLDAAYSSQTADTSGADDLAALWLDLGGSD